MLVRRYREYAKGLLGSITESQRWGIPAAAGDRWAVRFKGGWLPDHALVHQAAELRERHGPRQLSIVVLTDEHAVVRLRDRHRPRGRRAAAQPLCARGA